MFYVQNLQFSQLLSNHMKLMDPLFVTTHLSIVTGEQLQNYSTLKSNNSF